MKDQKKVKIIGFELKQPLGILKAHKLTFGKENNLNIFKGGVGHGKTTEQKAMQLGTQGSKTLVDKKLYGDSVIDTEIQLLDGDINVWVGCKSNDKGKLVYTLYTKDIDGKIVKEPIIDGQKATPSKYLEVLQTELTWRMDELTSENPTVQKKILLSLYQHMFESLGVIFDKKDPKYKDSPLGLIDEAEKVRDNKDSLRKQLGGIADDLIARGYDPDRPATIPEEKNIAEIDGRIKEQEEKRTIERTKSTSGKDLKLQEIKTEVQELTNKALSYNAKLKADYDKLKVEFDNQAKVVDDINASVDSINSNLNNLVLKEALTPDLVAKLQINIKKSLTVKDVFEPKQPKLIEFDLDRIVTSNKIEFDDEAKVILNRVDELRLNYQEVQQGEVVIDLSEFDKAITKLEQEKTLATETNSIVKAVHSFHEWRNANAEVVRLKNDYAKLLSKVDTGVEGLKIVPVEDDEKLELFLMYNGAYDPKYFGNPKGEYRKLSSYSGTQKPVICLLIQNYLLSKKPKAMRYMYVDNVPMDDNTVLLLEKMCTDLDLTIFLNYTGTFSKDDLKDGEILIENGEVFFN